MALISALKYSCATSSLYGIPRVVCSRPKPLKILWLFSIIIIYLVGVYSIANLCMKYLSYPTTTQVSEVLQETSGPQPDFIICNLNPIASNQSQLAGVPTMEEYTRLVKDIINCPECSQKEATELEAIEKDLLTPQGYFQYIGKKSAIKAGHNINDFMVSCQVEGKEGVAKVRKHCSDFLTVTPMFSPQYFNCFSFSSLPKKMEIVSVSLILFLDNFHGNDRTYFNPMASSAGVKVKVYEVNKTPASMTGGFELSPGTNSHIRINVEQRQYLSPPYGACGQVENFDAQTMYTNERCIKHCTENLITRSCNCKAGMFICDTNEDDTPYCMDSKDKVHSELHSHMTCVKESLKDIASRCNCPFQCEETTFTPQIVQSQWPANGYHKAFYEAMIKDKPIATRFGPLPVSDADRRTFAQLINDNFLMMNLDFGENRYRKLTQKHAYTVTDLFSDIAIQMYVFTGFTVFILVEMLDFLFRAVTGKVPNIQREEYETEEKEKQNEDLKL